MRRTALWCIALCCSACSCKSEQAPLPKAGAPSGVVALRYHLVRAKELVTLDPAHKRLRRGFGVALKRKVRGEGGWIGVTKSGLRVRMQDLEVARSSDFEGVALSKGRLADVWVIRDGALLFSKPDRASKARKGPARLARVRLVSRDGPEGYLHVQGGWMRARDVALPTLSARPASVADGERWIDIDLTSQTLVAYEGDDAVFATLISAGVGAEKTTFATPPGQHRIRAKLLGATMDNLEHQGVVPYFYEEVPFTQYIGRVALHGVYWHDRFGHPMSHGCINLSLSDAEFLFSFTQPKLPKSKREIPAPAGGTLVNIR